MARQEGACSHNGAHISRQWSVRGFLVVFRRARILDLSAKYVITANAGDYLGVNMEIVERERRNDSLVFGEVSSVQKEFTKLIHPGLVLQEGIA